MGAATLQGAEKAEAEAAATAVGHVTLVWDRLLKQQGRRRGDFPVDAFLDAMATQSEASLVLGPFMKLVAKVDDWNMRAIRASWERHSQPPSLRALAEREKRAGVQLSPGRLVESASLSLVWTIRMQRFWLGMLHVLADNGQSHVHMPTYATDVVYRSTVEPFHGMLVRGVFKTAIKAMPSHSELLRRLALGSAAGTPTPEQLARLSRALKRCIEVTTRVGASLRGMLDDLSLNDEQKV